MLKNKKKTIFLLFVFFGLIVSAFIDNAMANGGVTGESGGGDAGNDYSSCSKWPNAGSSSNALRALRVTIVDKAGQTKTGSNSVDFVWNSNVGSVSGYHSVQKTTKVMYLEYGSALTWTYGDIDLVYDATLASKLLAKFGSDINVGIGDKIKNLYNNYKSYVEGTITNDTSEAKYIVDTIYAETNAGTIQTNDVILFEPVTYVSVCQNDNAKYLYGTAYELNAYYGGGNANGGSAITGYVAKALYFSGDEIAPLTTNFPEPTDTSITYPGDNDNDLVIQKNGWGMGALWIGEIAKRCDLNVNDITNPELMWVESYPCKVFDLDGVENDSTCWKKKENGCCDSEKYEAAGITREQVMATYPQCFVDECKNDKLKYIDDNLASSFDEVNCSENTKKLINLEGYIDIDTQTDLRCLIADEYLVAVRSGWRLGCTFSDTLNLPSKYIETVGVGQHFVWPTSKTTFDLGKNNLRYPLTRTSAVKCLIYKYDSNGVIQYPNSITSNFKEKVSEFFEKKVSGNMVLKYKGKNEGSVVDNGAITEEKTASTVTTDGNNVINIQIDKVYTLAELSKKTKHYNIYAYYDHANSSYINNPVKNLSEYTKYGYPVLPMGSFNDEDVSIKYGIQFNDIKFSKLDKFSGSYICEKDSSTPQIPCECPPGTKNAGMDLIAYFPDTYTDFTAECSIAIDKYCGDVDGPYYCEASDGSNVDITNCVKDKIKTEEFEVAYNSCKPAECIPSLSCPNDPSISLTNCVKKGTYGGATKEEKYMKCVEKKCPKPSLEIIYRNIFLDDPFPGIKDNTRDAGSNWGGKKSLKSGGLGKKYIIDTADEMYEGKPMYSFKLTPEAINDIREYNKETGRYDDYELSCGDNEYCVSSALHDKFSGYLVGGTCQLKANAKIRGDDDCRLTSLVQ